MCYNSTSNVVYYRSRFMLDTPTHTHTHARYTGTEECPIRSVVNRVGHQLHKALSEKGIALLVNHGISEDKVSGSSIAGDLSTHTKPQIGSEQATIVHPSRVDRVLCVFVP